MPFGMASARVKACTKWSERKENQVACFTGRNKDGFTEEMACELHQALEVREATVSDTPTQINTF